MPGILGIGVDVVHLPRIATLIGRRGAQRLASRILSQQELLNWEGLSGDDATRRVSFLAVRWSLKEAAYKAVYPKIKPTWKEFTFQGLDGRRGIKPSLIYTPREGETALIGNIHCSVSHDGDYVFTTVLVENAPN